MVLIGYSGHAFVAYGILHAMGIPVTGYCDVSEKDYNPFRLPYLGSEMSEEADERIQNNHFFISVGDNGIRRKVANHFALTQRFPVNAVHPAAVVDPSVILHGGGIMIAAGACINPLVQVHEGAICNTGSVIEHECTVGAFAHVGPGAVLCGHVEVGEGAFIGAGAVVRQNIRIGAGAMVGMGAIVVRDVEAGTCVTGNPARIHKQKSS